MSNQDLDRRRAAHVTSAAASVHPFFSVRGEGAYLWDADGRRYLDFTSGIAVTNLGHSHPRIVEAVREQAARLQHTCFAVTMPEGYVRLAERLDTLSPGTSPKKSFLVNSGAEAVENAVKIARTATGRQAIVAFTHSFHGRTHMALSLTAKAEPYKAGFAPRAAEIYRAPYPYLYRTPFAEGDAQAFLDFLQDMVRTTVGESEVAAFLIEPVAGEGGFVPAPRAFLEGLRAYADRIGALWIADEIQTGVGRTGAWWAVDHFGLEPDLLTSAKALSSGFPLSAVVGKRDVMDRMEPGSLGSTFGGNPVSIAAALATLDVIEEEGLVARATEIGDAARARLRELQGDMAGIGDVRGTGAMVGIEFVSDDARTPDPDAAKAVVAHAREAGLLVLPTGTYGNVIRLLPPLTLRDDELAQGLDALERALRHALAGEPAAV